MDSGVDNGPRSPHLVANATGLRWLPWVHEPCRLEYNTRQREMQELDQRLEQNIRRLSKTTQRVSRDAQRAIEGVQKEWFSNRNEDQNKFGP